MNNDYFSTRESDIVSKKGASLKNIMNRGNNNNQLKEVSYE